MLELKNITKEYSTGGEPVEALRGISLQFRDSEFVSILGPSGCGKTTMLNIIGGLDQYTTGDLIINGRSTKDFRDRDWDGYRNHSIGFIFQSYNLIPHQTVLQNVELALTLSGVSKSGRRERAKKALEQVGLANQLKKRPSEMSGGQMQRVAIARAIVNNPDIILADEPTGALDTETSIQVMEILKEISKDRLVIMVTHNPELAERYSTRIVRVLDGKITSDSRPLSEAELRTQQAEDQRKSSDTAKKKKPSMSFPTAFHLSLKNLFTKKGRTLLTSFAGSIGIIGIALILAVSQGTTSYINAIQEDTLSSYPITLEAQSMDLSTLMSAFIGAAHSNTSHENDAVYQKPMVYDMVNALSSSNSTENDLKSFKKYLEETLADSDSSVLQEALSGVQYTYDTNLLVYTKNIDGDIIHSDSQDLMRDLLLEYFGMDLSSMMNMSEEYGMSAMSSLSPASSSMTLWQEMLSGNDGELINPLLKKQYDVVYGSWPTAYNEIVLVLDENNEIDDMALYALGLISKEDMDDVMKAAVDKSDITVPEKHWSYAELCDMEFRVILNSNCYTLDEHTGLYTDLRSTNAGLKYLYDNAVPLKISGVIRPSKDAVSTMLSGSIGYTGELTRYIVRQSSESPALLAQQETPGTDIFTGLPFREAASDLSDTQKEADFRAYIANLSESDAANVYTQILCIPSSSAVDSFVSQTLGSMTREDLESAMLSAMIAETGMNSDELLSYMRSMSDEDLTELFTQALEAQYKAQYAEQVRTQLSAMTVPQLAAALTVEAANYTTEQCAAYYDEVMNFSDSTYTDNLQTLGYVDLDSPSSINLYASSFEDKDTLEDMIAQYNETVDDLSKIEYTDYVGLMMSSVTSIINAITYVLIAFVAVSLIVSSIMIGVITLISVQERTKEIGILRAIGASKRNVSSMFNAETVIIGFTSGALGVLVTYLLCLPINWILQRLTGIHSLSAYLPVPAAAALILISMALTLISGIIPSKSAAKKDPVVALRSE